LKKEKNCVGVSRARVPRAARLESGAAASYLSAMRRATLLAAVGVVALALVILTVAVTVVLHVASSQPAKTGGGGGGGSGDASFATLPVPQRSLVPRAVRGAQPLALSSSLSAGSGASKIPIDAAAASAAAAHTADLSKIVSEIQSLHSRMDDLINSVKQKNKASSNNNDNDNNSHTDNADSGENTTEDPDDVKINDKQGWLESLERGMVAAAKAAPAINSSQVLKRLSRLQPLNDEFGRGVDNNHQNAKPVPGILAAIGTRALELDRPHGPLVLREQGPDIAGQQFFLDPVTKHLTSPSGDCLFVRDQNFLRSSKCSRLDHPLPTDGGNGGNGGVRARMSEVELQNSYIWEYKPVGRWDRMGFFRNPATNLCITAPNIGVKIINYYMNGEYKPYPQVDLQPCSRMLCRQLWMPLDKQQPVEKQLLQQGKPGAKASASAATTHQVNPSEVAKRKGLGGRLLCWVMTHASNHATKAMAINATWGAGCDTLLFMTSAPHSSLPTVVLDLGRNETRETLWRKAIQAWLHVFAQHLKDHDWFMRADDDTFVNMDNLREYLAGFNPEDTHYFGRQMKAGGLTFYSGGSTHVLSRQALSWFGQSAVLAPDSLFSRLDTFADDYEISKTLSRIDIPTEDTRDSEGRQRFLTLNIENERSLLASADPTFWFLSYSLDPVQEDGNCCSKRWVASHYIEAHEQLIYDDLHAIGCEAAGSDPWDARFTQG
jgi:hypothetical protein